MNIATVNGVIQELQQGRLFGLLKAKREQNLAAQAGYERRVMKHGEVKFSIHPKFYHYWGQRLGYQCWDDPQFVREFLRDNPECRVKNISSKIMSGWMPGTASRFRKSYAT